MFRLTERDVERFQADGFLFAERLIDRQTVRLLRKRFVHLFRGEFATGIRPDEVNWQEGTGDPSLTRQICNGWKADPAIARVVLRADLGQAIARLAGWPGTRLMIDNVLWKPPGCRPLAYHQDNAYLQWFTPPEVLSCWIALDQTSADGGTLEFVRGSHRWAHCKAAKEFHGPSDYQKQMRTAARRQGSEPDIVKVIVPEGGGSFHHGWTWHGSGYNRTDKQRRSLVLHAMRCDAEFEPRRFASGIGPIYSRYRRLGDQEMDENHFPIVWRNDGYRTPSLDRF